MYFDTLGPISVDDIVNYYSTFVDLLHLVQVLILAVEDYKNFLLIDLTFIFFNWPSFLEFLWFGLLSKKRTFEDVLSTEPDSPPLVDTV